jgi:hypothetical protein
VFSASVWLDHSSLVVFDITRRPGSGLYSIFCHLWTAHGSTQDTVVDPDSHASGYYVAWIAHLPLPGNRCCTRRQQFVARVAGHSQGLGRPLNLIYKAKVSSTYCLSHTCSVVEQQTASAPQPLPMRPPPQGAPWRLACIFNFMLSL